MARFTALERAVMDALAWDLDGVAPDLAGQFEESRPGQRRNTGQGLFNEMIVDRNRPPPTGGPTGDFGTVHAMVGALPDPIAFRARLRDGVLLGLVGDSYGQDTRAIDFATVPFDQVFTLNDQGESIAFEPAELMPESPLLELQRHAEQSLPVASPALFNVGPLQRLQDVGPAPSGSLTDILFPARAAEPSPAMSKDEKVSLIVGLWVILFAAVAVTAILFDVSPIFAGVLAIFAGRALQTPKGLAALKRGLDAWRRARAERSA